MPKTASSGSKRMPAGSPPESVRKLAGAGEQNGPLQPAQLGSQRSRGRRTAQPSCPPSAIGAPPCPTPASHHRRCPRRIETRFYTAQVDPATGALASLKLKPSGREMLGGPANVLVAEKGAARTTARPAMNLIPRPERPRLAPPATRHPRINVTENAVAITVEADGTFYRRRPMHADHRASTKTTRASIL